MSQFFELHYHLPEDPARLFDVAQGLAGRRNILKRGGTVKVKPFTETCRRLLFQCIAFAVLTVLRSVNCLLALVRIPWQLFMPS